MRLAAIRDGLEVVDPFAAPHVPEDLAGGRDDHRGVLARGRARHLPRRDEQAAVPAGAAPAARDAQRRGAEARERPVAARARHAGHGGARLGAGRRGVRRLPRPGPRPGPRRAGRRDAREEAEHHEGARAPGRRLIRGCAGRSPGARRRQLRMTRRRIPRRSTGRRAPVWYPLRGHDDRGRDTRPAPRGATSPTSATRSCSRAVRAEDRAARRAGHAALVRGRGDALRAGPARRAVLRHRARPRALARPQAGQGRLDRRGRRRHVPRRHRDVHRRAGDRRVRRRRADRRDRLRPPGAAGDAGRRGRSSPSWSCAR